MFFLLLILFKLFTGDNSSRLRDNYSSDESSISDNIVDITEETEPEETKESKAENKMPDLIGQRYEDIKSKIEEKYNIKISADFEYNGEYQEGLIFWQEVEKGKKIKEGDTVKIKVSKGTEKVEVPDFEGYTFDEYTELLDELNIPYTEVTEINYEYEDGYVTKVSPGPGKEINITDDEILTVYYAKNPEPTEAPTEPPTEAPTKAPEPETPATDPPADEPEESVPDVIIE